MSGAQFWLAAFQPTPRPASAGDAASPLLRPPARAEPGVFALAVDVWRVADEFAVFVSNADAADAPGTLECRICFANSTRACDDLRDHGFPAVEARIGWAHEADVLEVFAPFFTDVERMAQTPTDPILRLRAVRFPEELPTGLEAAETFYAQLRVAPARNQPDTKLATQQAIWQLPRRKGRPETRAGVPVTAWPARYPTLNPLPTESAPDPSATRVWTGSLGPDGAQPGSLAELVSRLSDRTPPLELPVFGTVTLTLPPPVRLMPRADAFVAPAYRFDDIEVLGFRIDLGEFGDQADRLMAALVEPLNFHLAEGTGVAPDFRYRPASRTLMIELLRYGKMRLDRPTPPLSAGDYQSQHELLVRLLVGAVDDGTAQARNPATFVPAIFVDNPWSKLLGREVQGFDKRLAQFCVGGGKVLNPDGRLAGTASNRPPEPLGDVTEVRLVEHLGHDATAKTRILTLECGREECANWDELDPIDLRLALVNSSFFGAQWRQSDFDAVEFRRSFAETVFTDSLLGFRSIQVSPVDERRLDKAWITGRFSLDDVRVVFPAGIAILSLHDVASAPEAWRLLCRFLSRATGSTEIILPTGEWYRMKCSTDLRIDDGPVDVAVEW